MTNQAPQVVNYTVLLRDSQQNGMCTFVVAMN